MGTFLEANQVLFPKCTNNPALHFFLESLRSVLLSMELRVGNRLFRAQL